MSTSRRVAPGSSVIAVALEGRWPRARVSALKTRPRPSDVLPASDTPSGTSCSAVHVVAMPATQTIGGVGVSLRLPGAQLIKKQTNAPRPMIVAQLANAPARSCGARTISAAQTQGADAATRRNQTGRRRRPRREGRSARATPSASDDTVLRVRSPPSAECDEQAEWMAWHQRARTRGRLGCRDRLPCAAP